MGATLGTGKKLVLQREDCVKAERHRCEGAGTGKHGCCPGIVRKCAQNLPSEEGREKEVGAVDYRPVNMSLQNLGVRNLIHMVFGSRLWKV